VTAALPQMTCGIWPAGRRLVAVITEGGGSERTLVLASSDDARWGLVQLLTRSVCTELVVPETILRADPIVRMAAAEQVPMWSVPRAVIDPIRRAAGISERSPKKIAAVLARLPAIPVLRQQLRRVALPVTSRQLRLL